MLEQTSFTSKELARAIRIARGEAFEEAAKIAEADNTPGYGARAPKIADQIEWLAETQRRNIAEAIRAVPIFEDEREDEA